MCREQTKRVVQFSQNKKKQVGKKDPPTRNFSVTHSQNNFNRVSESYIFIFQNKTPDRLKIEKLKFFIL